MPSRHYEKTAKVSLDGFCRCEVRLDGVYVTSVSGQRSPILFICDWRWSSQWRCPKREPRRPDRRNRATTPRPSCAKCWPRPHTPRLKLIYWSSAPA